jgi:hypothetical protein
MMDGAGLLAEMMDSIPTHQLDRIQAKCAEDPHRAVATDEFAAMLCDERMFGTDAIIRKKRSGAI